MKNRDLVSIIIPVYGVEKYLPECLESVCSQTYENLEIIVVDDESPDKSGEIADEYAKKDRRVKTYHIQNRGAAGARNYGLDVCTGSYIMFVDSDDWIESNMVEALVSACEEQNCDIAQCQYIDEFVDKSEKHIYIEENQVCDSLRFIETMLKKWEYVINCNKIYKIELLRNLRFVEGRCIDDEFFTYKAVLNANSIALLTGYYYHYRMRKSSAMGSEVKAKQRLRDQVDFVTERYPVLQQRFPKLKKDLLAHMCEVYMQVMRNPAVDDEIYDYAKQHLKKYGKMACCMSIDVNMKKSILVYLAKKKMGKIKVEQKTDTGKWFE